MEEEVVGLKCGADANICHGNSDKANIACEVVYAKKSKCNINNSKQDVVNDFELKTG